MELYKYHGAGNDFLMIDGRESVEVSTSQIKALCDRHTGFGADGLILVRPSKVSSFRMEYFNSDGSTGMMCGNGGRCVCAFADALGLKGDSFEAADGIHSFEILSRNGGEKIVKIGMKDVDEVEKYSDGYFLDTGTRHFVKFVDDVSAVKIQCDGPAIRHDSRFAPIGVNANFVSLDGDEISIRTFEKGVEDETLACGTGIVASAMASHLHLGRGDGRWSYNVKAAISTLSVSFLFSEGKFSDVRLTGPTVCVGRIEPL